MTKKPEIDWERIEAEYRTGQLSVREIARQCNVSHVAIAKRAKRDGWTQNLAARVREAVTAKLVTSTVTGQKASEIVEAAAARGVDVVLRHRKDIAVISELKDRLAEKARTLIKGVACLDDLGDATSAVESLSRTFSRLIPLERQAFNLDEKTAAVDTDETAALLRGRTRLREMADAI